MIAGDLTFLIAEDDEMFGRALQRAFRPHGEASLVKTVEAARLALERGSFDAIVADVGLPDGSGLDLVADARSVDPTLPALLLSGNVDAARLRRAHVLGVHFLLKPLESAQIRLFAARARHRSKARRARILAAVERWQRDYALTDAEADLLVLGASGTPRWDLARRRDVSEATVKKQVKLLLAKTGDLTMPDAVVRLLHCVVDES